jgi:hypothetical protein
MQPTILRLMGQRVREVHFRHRINLGFDYTLTRSLDLSAVYSGSVYSALNTFSFGIEVNVVSLIKKPSGQ